MKNAILIPLYRPDGKHLLLLKSVISRCSAAGSAVIYVVADGPHSQVDWTDNSILQLLTAAESRGIELLIYSYLESNGYPGCYRRLIADALLNGDVQVVHFVDQDDYCLPSRFADRSSHVLQASGALVSDSNFSPLAEHRFDSTDLAALLETPSLGMTFSVPRALAAAYLALCKSFGFVSAIPHDFVLSQMALREGQLGAVAGCSMIYVQHSGNTIGYGHGWRRVFRWVRNCKSVLQQLTRHAKLLDILYAERGWPHGAKLHRSHARSFLYRAILRLVPR